MKSLPYITGKYALVDYNYGFIWLTVPDYDAASLIKHTMSSHLTLVIVDLSQFEIYTDELIDSYVCLDWKVEVNSNFLKRYIDAEQMYGDIYNKVKFDIDNSSLINVPNHSMLTKERIIEVQRCIILLYQIHTHISNSYRTQRAHDKIEEIYKQDLNNICDIFRKEIYYNEVVDKLYQYANNIKYNLDLLVFILRAIDKAHE